MKKSLCLMNSIPEENAALKSEILSLKASAAKLQSALDQVSKSISPSSHAGASCIYADVAATNLSSPANPTSLDTSIRHKTTPPKLLALFC